MIGLWIAGPQRVTMRKVFRVLGYATWLRSLGQPPRVVPDRYHAWEYVAKSFATRVVSSVVVIELGVAHGHSTRKILSIFQEQPNLTIEAFDSFQGLPESWNGYPAGTFSRSGNPPYVADDRVRFHVGLVEDTIDTVVVDDLLSTSQARFILFDLDLLSPSVWCATHIAPYLCEGDFVYFDELIDYSEQTAKAVMDLRLRNSSLELSLVCVTALGALFEIRRVSALPE